MKQTTIMTAVLSATLLGASLANAAEPKLTPALVEKGKAAYTANCLICHGDKGDGNGAAGAAMNPKPRNFAKDPFKVAKNKGNPTPADVFKSISEGVPGTAMVAFGHLPEEDRWGLAHYVLSFRKGKK